MRVEMLKEGCVTVLEWLVRVFNICFMLDWVIACMVPLYKGKGDVHACSNFRGIRLLSVVGKVYGRVLINGIRDKTENVIAEVQGGFRKGGGCTDQIFIVRQICEKYLGKGKDVCFAFLNLEKAYDRVDRDAMWNVLRLYVLEMITCKSASKEPCRNDHVMLLISPAHSFVPAVQIHMPAIIHLTNRQWKLMKMRMMMMVAMMKVMFLETIIASEVFVVMKCLEETENYSNGAACWRR